MTAIGIAACQAGASYTKTTRQRATSAKASPRMANFHESALDQRPPGLPFEFTSPAARPAGCGVSCRDHRLRDLGGHGVRPDADHRCQGEPESTIEVVS